MNQFFSFKRFSLLVSKHWAENKKGYALSLLAFIGLLIIRFLFFILIGDKNDTSESVQQTTFFFSLFTIGTIYASQYFRDLGSKAKASNFLLVPSSSFEKFLCSLLYTVVLFILVFTAAYYFVDILMLTISNEVIRTENQDGKEPVINVFEVGFYMLREDLKINALLFFLAIQSAFLLGSVYFKKYVFIKTIISCFIVYVLLFGLIYIPYKPLFPGNSNEGEMPRWIEQIIGILVMYVIAPILWIITYYSLKQKQV